MVQKLSFVILTIFLLSACGGQKSVVKKYYMIEEPDASAEVDRDTTSAIKAWCEVNEVEVYPAYDTRRIVFRDDSHQIRYFGDHEWAVRPPAVLTPMIINHLSQNKIFTRVSDRFWERSPNYRVNTTIFKIEVGHGERKRDFDAHLKLRFELLETQTDTIVVAHTANRETVLEKRDLNLLAASISQMFHEELNEFATRVKDVLSEK